MHATSDGAAPSPVAGEPLIEIHDVAVHYRAPHGRGVARALDSLSLQWRREEILGIVGESGAGKSTLARVMVGLLPLVRGAVALDGREVVGKRGERSLRQRVQMVFQDPYEALNPRHSVRQIMYEPLVVNRVPSGEREERVTRALRDVGLAPERFLWRYPHELSGGERQRVAIAAALVLEPDGLICDEPVSMLDVSIRVQILQVLLDLRRRRGLALLFITHDLSLAWILCDRIAVMYLGRIVEEGSTEQVIATPHHPYTQALVNVVPAPQPARGRARGLLRGELPDLARIPPGCRFHPRCPKRFDPCDRQDPELFDVEEGHRCACLLFDPNARVGCPSPGAPSAEGLGQDSA